MSASSIAANIGTRRASSPPPPNAPLGENARACGPSRTRKNLWTPRPENLFAVKGIARHGVQGGTSFPGTPACRNRRGNEKVVPSVRPERRRLASSPAFPESVARH